MYVYIYIYGVYSTGKKCTPASINAYIYDGCVIYARVYLYVPIIRIYMYIVYVYVCVCVYMT